MLDNPEPTFEKHQFPANVLNLMRVILTTPEELYNPEETLDSECWLLGPEPFIYYMRWIGARQAEAQRNFKLSVALGAMIGSVEDDTNVHPIISDKFWEQLAYSSNLWRYGINCADMDTTPDTINALKHEVGYKQPD